MSCEVVLVLHGFAATAKSGFVESVQNNESNQNQFRSPKDIRQSILNQINNPMRIDLVASPYQDSIRTFLVRDRCRSPIDLLVAGHVFTHHPSHVIFRCATKVVLVLIPCVRATPEGSILVVLLGDG